MQKASCKISVLSIREGKDENSPMISQMLYGEYCTIVKEEGLYAKIQMDCGQVEGWVFALSLQKEEEIISKTLIKESFVKAKTLHGTMLLSIGSEVFLDKEMPMNTEIRENLNKDAYRFLNVPYLCGGRSFFGIDEGALVQLVYKINGIFMPRYAKEQAQMGEIIDFLEESQSGDLAFFQDENSEIVHCGIMIGNSEIIHAFGKVRVDLIDNSGIFNKELNKYTHKLRFIKRVLK